MTFEDDSFAKNRLDLDDFTVEVQL
ncbi:3-oxoacyl-(acyl carrier protein) synthase [Shewanella benthica KT99]|uniref:3-oxoacyl-(Acyl carrier protein) synthase n=1 Tax=Shewanella benthica KT99 TaxID=314608 RepID=A9DB14_9GAMM|nr:3-oxoacyl-(acyl carrier protein) synthase [Shewanella benthica KT99]